MKITALQLGRTDFSQRFEICPEAEWNYEPELSMKDPEYDIAIIDRVLSDEESDILARIVRAHCLFVLSDVPVSENEVSHQEPLRKEAHEKRPGDLSP